MEDPANQPIPAPNMTVEADAHQPIPGAAAIPADMPNSPHGDVPLEYTLQNFNALVAANTAMETALADNEIQFLALQARIQEMKDTLALQQAHSVEAREAHMDRRDLLSKSGKRVDELTLELDYARKHGAALQRRLDRSLGYLDRVLDDEDGIRSGETRTVPAPKPPVGPALGEIPDAVRRDRSGRTDMPHAFAAAESIRFDDGTVGRRRRY